MQRLTTCVFAAIGLVVLSGTQATAQNLFGNPGFEDPATYTEDGPPFVGSWEGFQGGGADASRGTTMPRTGVAHLLLDITADNTFAGAFQDVEGLVPGQLVNFSVWHKSGSIPYNLVSELRIEWRKVGQGAEVSRIQVLPIPTADYTQASLVAQVPPGADTARAVYAIQSFTNTGLPDAGTVFVDDASLTIIPEPATMAIVGLAVFCVAGFRRRK